MISLQLNDIFATSLENEEGIFLAPPLLFCLGGSQEETRNRLQEAKWIYIRKNTTGQKGCQGTD